MTWAPTSWRMRPVRQLPLYPDPGALAAVEARLASADPLVSAGDVGRLRASIAEVAAGRAFLLQGGDCAESFAEFDANKVRRIFNLLREMGAMLAAGGAADVVTVARIAGQFAKPRSSDTETIGEVTLPVYRGDIVNGPDFDPAVRSPNPERMLHAHRQAQVTIELLNAFGAAAYADAHEIARRAQARLGLVTEPRRAAASADREALFTSHEALLLPYEQALTRWDEKSQSWWASSGHMIWIGDRTRQLDSAHVEYARGVANPVGVKCGPSLSPDELLRLIERLDPDNLPGKLVLIGRFGARQAADCLAPLMRATRRAGRHVVWTIDPMHGNTVSAGGRKTRLLADIVAETRSFFAVAESEMVHPGGVHLEMTGADVTECLGGSVRLSEADLPRRYLTHCDPRLNDSQALDIAGELVRLMRRRAHPASHAA